MCWCSQLLGVQAGQHAVEERLKAAPELVNLPQDVQSLSTSVASFGSQIRDLNTTVTMLKNENNQLQEAYKTLLENVTSVKVHPNHAAFFLADDKSTRNVNTR
jgi:uncharacterized protein (DUF3084 family)